MTRTPPCMTVALFVLAAFTGGCGGSSSSATDLPSGCVIADVSGSTHEARAEYVTDFTTFATHIGTDGSGKLCVVLAAGDPQAEAQRENVFVGPKHKEQSSAHPESPKIEIGEAVKGASEAFEGILSEPEIGAHGSSLIEAALAAEPALAPGDELLYLSDGIQSSPSTGDFHEADLSPSGITRMLDKLERSGLLAHLQGVHVIFPLLLFHPGGLHMSQEREAAIRSFWENWASRCQATISFTMTY